MEQLIEIDSDNFDKICRCCLVEISENNVIISNLSQLLHTLFSIEVREGMPKNMCRDCTEKILRFCEFRNKVIESNTILTTFISQNVVKDALVMESSEQGMHYLQIETKEESNEMSNKSESSEKIINGEKHQELNPEELEVYNCVCGETFHDYESYASQHICPYATYIDETTRKTSFVCDICGDMFSRNSSLRRHRKLHFNQDPFFCKLCAEGFQTKDDYKEHRSSKHKPVQVSNGPYICEICRKILGSQSTLKTHLLRHKEKNYLCSTCGKSFFSNASLKVHHRVHSGERPYSCEICGKKFNQSAGLRSHMLIHTGNKRYVCEICSKSYTLKHHLAYHMVTHTGKASFSCSLCGKNFRYKANLSVHVKMHKGEFRYKCEQCGKNFYHSSAMRKHRATHFRKNSMAINDAKTENEDMEHEET